MPLPPAEMSVTTASRQRMSVRSLSRSVMSFRSFLESDSGVVLCGVSVADGSIAWTRKQDPLRHAARGQSAVALLDLDPDRAESEVLRGAERAPAPHERVEHGATRRSVGGDERPERRDRLLVG